VNCGTGAYIDYGLEAYQTSGLLNTVDELDLFETVDVYAGQADLTGTKRALTDLMLRSVGMDNHKEIVMNYNILANDMIEVMKVILSSTFDHSFY
jgi:hypothetical protein